ncbi:hypothetical protein [Spiroplasma floricola]|uniref:Uncharacterized protein n=1 Tax=Spiroplasma floricola 23-6 TaxID=1336749 RepID=A0A2K8SDZ6_9MOLU|nr:hypothetical protein [Spiroplasma floricola]AUB31643.1 hypothetical protein SFLOR_v1c05910 [Spiroplasma floricola 23-6]
MNIDIFANYKEDLKNYLKSLKSDIKLLIYKEFKNYIFNTKLDSHNIFEKSFFTKAFCELATYCYLQNYNSKFFNSKNSNLINNYSKFSEENFLNKKFENVVIVSAQKLLKEDEQLNDFIKTLTDTLKVNVWIRNLNWYNNEHFLEEVKLSKKLKEYKEELFKIIKSYNKELFDLVSNNKFVSTKLSFREDWNFFLEKKVSYSLEKFIFTPINYDEDNYKKKISKLSELVTEDTLFIFVNNVEVNSKYKTTLLNDIKLFSEMIKFNNPIFTIDKNNNFFSFLNILSYGNFKNFNDISKFFTKRSKENKPEKLKLQDSKNVDPLNWYWNKILEDEDKQEDLKKILKKPKAVKKIKNRDLEKTITFSEHKELNEIFKEEKNIKEIDLEKTVTFSEHSNLDEILKEHESNELNNNMDELLLEVTQENMLLSSELSKKANKEFTKFIKLFDKEINNIELTTKEYNKDKYFSFKKMINQKNIKEVLEFLTNKNDNLFSKLKNKKMTKQDIMNYYTLYIKVKSCLYEMKFLKLK